MALDWKRESPARPLALASLQSRVAPRLRVIRSRGRALLGHRCKCFSGGQGCDGSCWRCCVTEGASPESRSPRQGCRGAGPGVLGERSCFEGRKGPGRGRAAWPRAELLPGAWRSPSRVTRVTTAPEEDGSPSRVHRRPPGLAGAEGRPRRGWQAAPAEAGGWRWDSSPGWHAEARPWGHRATLRRKRGREVS